MYMASHNVFIYFVGAFGKVFHGKFTDKTYETVIEVAVKTMKGYSFALHS